LTVGRARQLDRAPVLVLEEEPDFAEEIRLELEANGHPVKLTRSAAEALTAVRAAGTTVLVFMFDRMLQGDDDLSVVETLRSEGVATPVLVMSALSAVDDRIPGLKVDGDDYFIKPSDVREPNARVEALLRRHGDVRATWLRAGDIEMDLLERKVRCAGRAVELLPREFKLLEYFMRRPGQIVTRSVLLKDVWNFKFTPDTNVVDVQIGNLRRKLDPSGARKFIVNLRAVGFKLNIES
jgi:two-component system OmpR family response regulator